MLEGTLTSVCSWGKIFQKQVILKVLSEKFQTWLSVFKVFSLFIPPNLGSNTGVISAIEQGLTL